MTASEEEKWTFKSLLGAGFLNDRQGFCNSCCQGHDTKTPYRNSMEQCPSCEANRSSSYSRNSLDFMEPEGSLPHSQAPATCPCSEPPAILPIPFLTDPF
jgi:hypothetical protein